jgi:hypothetical protein
MGGVLSLFWSEESSTNNNKDAKYKQGIGPSAETTSSATQSQAKKTPKASTVGAQPKKKRAKGKVTKAMIGQPGNFQHTAHIGAKEMKTGSLDLGSLKNQMEKGIMFTPAAGSSTATPT